MRRFPALAGLVLALAACMPLARAQDMDAMPGMHHHAAPATGTPGRAHGDHATAHDHAHEHSPTNTPTPTPGPHPHDPAMQHAAHAPTGHAMGPAQGGKPPPDARDPDYSDGVRMDAARGIDMAMEDDPAFFALHADRLEAFHATRGDGRQWDIEGGYGSSRDKLWLRTEGERRRGRLDHADVELLWQHAVAAFWDTQLGVRTDTGAGPGRRWLAFGIQGLAPYWFELEATGYLGPAGRTAARLRADYELLFTQRLVLQPELEVNAYGKADPARGLGSGVSDASLGLRLRYEIRREVAPYVGGVWTRRFGGPADHGEGVFDWQWVAGVRIRL
jgi:copper resistance protein B